MTLPRLRPYIGSMSQFVSAYKQLRPSERAFVDAYVRQAEREADRTHERISNVLYRAIPDDVREASQGMLDRPMVLAAINERITAIAADNELTVQRIVKELMAIGFSSVADYMDIHESGVIDWDFAKATPEQLAAIKSYEVEETLRGRKVKITLHDKLAGLERLAKFVGMLEADNPHYRAMSARPVAPAALPGSVTVEQAGDRYGRMVGG